jgi:hypothetical protein
MPVSKILPNITLMKKLFALVIIFLCSLQLHAQTYKGRLLDAETNSPVGFGSIGILHRDVGTVTDENGNFTLNTQKAAPNDTVKISMLGYESRLFTLPQFKQQFSAGAGIFKLTPKNNRLKEVVVKPRNTAWLVAGNTTETKSIMAGFSSNDLGSEVGTVLKYRKKKPGRIHKVHFNIAMNRYDTLLFRVNLHRFKNGTIGESLLSKPVFVKTTQEDGTLSVDLSDQQIYITRDCLVSLEWIKNLPAGGLMFSAGFLNSDSFSRKTSQGDWKKAPAGLGFWADIEYEK